MKETAKITSGGAMLLLAMSSLPVLAGELDWMLPERSLPVTGGASEVLQQNLQKLPAPDVAQARKSVAHSEKEWLQVIASREETRGKAARALAEKLGVRVKKARIAGVRVFWLTPAQLSAEHGKHLFVYLHGGAYVFNGGDAGISEGVLIASRLGIPVVSIDYHMPPKYPFPTAVNEVAAVYRELLRKHAPGAMAIGGTAAGGGLTLASLLKFRELRLALPAAFYAGTPWSDLTGTGDSYHTNEGADHLLVTYPGLLAESARLYAGGRNMKHPMISPVYGDYSGFPPAYLVTGTRDLFLSNTVRVHRKLRVAGIEANLNVYEGFSHADYLFMAETPESQQVYAELGHFLKKHLH